VGSREALPERERHVLDAVVSFGAPDATQLAYERVRGVDTDHVLEIRDRDEQRAVGIAGAQEGVDFEHGACRIARVDADAVVHNSFEHGQGADPHATMFA
jgi:hypothetical protein